MRTTQRVIEIGGAAQRGERDAAGGNSEEHEIFDAARAQDQVQLVFGECADTLFIDDEIFGATDGGVECGGGCADYEEIVFFEALEAGFGVGNFWMAGGKAQAYVDDVELFLAREFYRFGWRWGRRSRQRDEAENTFLDSRESALLSFSDLVSWGSLYGCCYKIEQLLHVRPQGRAGDKIFIYIGSGCVRYFRH